MTDLSHLPIDTLSDVSDDTSSEEEGSEIPSPPAVKPLEHRATNSGLLMCSKRSAKRRRNKYKQYAEIMENPEISRWWKRRYDLFQRFDEGIQMDAESWYSVTPEEVARAQAKVCACNVIVDAFAGAGGNSIQFAQTCGFVIAVDNNATRLASNLQPNARVYGVVSRIDCVCADTTAFLRCLRLPPPSPDSSAPAPTPTPTVDTVFMSPPWGGPDYLSTSLPLPPASASSWNRRRRRQRFLADLISASGDGVFDISAGIPCLDAAVKAARCCSSRVAVYLPRNSSIGQVLALGWAIEGGMERQEVTIEEYWVRARRLALCAFIGKFEALTVNKDSE